MSHKLNALITAALALSATTSAHAILQFGREPSNGNSSFVFAAIDNAGTISYTADLSVYMASFLPFVSGQTLAAGSLSGAGTTAVWNLKNNSYRLNGVVQTGTYSWNSNLNSFLSSSGVAGNYQWGVFGGDTVQGNPSPTNVVRNINIVFSSGTVVDYDTSNESGINPAATSGAAGQISQFLAGSNTAAGNTHTVGVAGSNVATSGTAFLGTSLVNPNIGNFSQQFGNNNYLQNPGATSYLSWVAVNGQTSSTATLGAPLSIGSDPARPSTWFWNEASGDLTYTVPVPEVGTYAMFGVGLAAMGIAVRRRERKA